jgi:Amt family ammonium transporter
MDPVIAADTAWVLASFAAVSLMIPGLAIFYGGMVGVRSTLNIMMMVFGGCAVVAVLWIVFGYGLVLGDSVLGLGLIGNPIDFIGLGQDIFTSAAGDEVPPALIAAFHLLFAAITTAIVCAAVAGRMKFSAWLVFSGVWVTLVYFPIAHWVFAFDGDETQGGWIANDWEVVDYAGGTAVHINSGVAALALALVIGKRRGFPSVSRPHSLPLTLLGAGILFFGWFGFNGGSAGGANGLAAFVILTTIAAALAGVLGWLIVEKLWFGHATTLGAASGLIAGLVGITPAASAVNPLGAILIGLVTGGVCCWAVTLKFKLKYDESLDAFAVHGVGGVVGCIMIGFIAVSSAPAGVAGLFTGGGIMPMVHQIVAVAATIAYSFIVTWIIAKVLDKTIGLRVDSEVEYEGLDTNLHGETAYVHEESAPRGPIAPSSVTQAAEAIAAEAGEAKPAVSPVSEEAKV